MKDLVAKDDHLDPHRTNHRRLVFGSQSVAKDSSLAPHQSSRLRTCTSSSMPYSIIRARDTKQ